MNSIFINSKNGIIKATVVYNPFTKNHQLIIGNLIYNDFFPNEEEHAIQYMRGSFQEEKIIKPNITLLISQDNPLSSQCSNITGDSYNLSDFEDLYGTQLIRHRKTGLILRVLSNNQIREQFYANWFYQEGAECFKDNPVRVKRDLTLKAGEFLYLGHVFKGIRKLGSKEDFFSVTSKLRDIWRTKKDAGNTDWNRKEFYEQAEKAGAGEYDIFQMDDLFNIVPCENFLGEYREAE